MQRSRLGAPAFAGALLVRAMPRTLRPAARILLVDGAGRVLLFRFTPEDGRAPFWCTPGGAVDPGESYEEAARRELYEETGIIADPGREVMRREVEFLTLEGIEVTADDINSFGGLVRHSGEEYLYVLRGSMELHSDIYALLPLNTGDSVYFDSGMAHAYIKTGGDPCEVLCVCAGPGMQRVAESAGQSWDLVSPDGNSPTGLNPVSDIET